MRRLTLLSLLFLSGLATAQVKIANDRAITPERLRDHLEFIASDEMEGRDTPSRGLDTATLYVATQLKLWGATPAGDDGTFFQRIPLVQKNVDIDKSVITFGGKSFTFGEGLRGTNKSVTASGQMVYAGHGYVLKSKGIDPYAGLDVRGKIVVVASGRPAGTTFRDFAEAKSPDVETPVMAAEERGAVAVLTIPSGALSTDSMQNMNRLSRLSPESPVTGLANVTAGPGLTTELFAGEKVGAADVSKGGDAPETGFALSDSKSLNLNVVEHREVTYARNVVAIVPGTDAKLKSEYVAFGAHSDHLGMANSGTDRVYNGADDDGSGTVSILEIAHAFLTGPRPKRSLLFVWHCGEEKGLWGSAWYTNHPTVDLKNVITQLNIDMIGRSKPAGDTKAANKVLTGPDEVYVVGSSKMSTDLQRTSERVNASFLKFAFNYKYDDPTDTERIFFRSDHYNYAHKGIPIIFYFDGVHEDYHRVSDEVSKIDFDKMSRIARTVYATGWTIANGPRPVVDKPLKE